MFSGGIERDQWHFYWVNQGASGAQMECPPITN